MKYEPKKKMTVGQFRMYNSYMKGVFDGDMDELYDDLLWLKTYMIEHNLTPSQTTKLYPHKDLSMEWPIIGLLTDILREDSVLAPNTKANCVLISELRNHIQNLEECMHLGSERSSTL